MNRIFNPLNFTIYRGHWHTAFRPLKKSSLMVFLMYAIYLITTPSVVAQVGLSHAHPNLARGAGNDKTVERYPWDSINLFNGNLNVAIPLGIKYPLAREFAYQFSLNYNSQVWDIDQPATTIATNPTKYSNAGFGWDISFGRLIPPVSNGTLTGRWVYISPDGAQHVLYSNLHAGTVETDPDDIAMYSRDGSYYRMYASSTTSRLIESPDGTQSLFQLTDGQWKLTQIGDRFNNRLWFNYSTPNVWVITDNHGRTQTLYFKADPAGYYPAIVDRLVLAAFNGTTATYTFNYATANVARPSIDTDPATSATVNLSQLTGITSPDGSQHLFTYHNTGTTDFAGRLASLRLPTMGKIEWTYQTYAYTTGANPTALGALFRRTTGVASRKMINSSGATDGIWTYTPSLQPSGTEERQMTNTVKTPLGDKTVYYFSVNTTSSGPEWIKSDYGMPFTKNEFDRPRNPTNNAALASRGAVASASSTVNSSYPASAAINGDRKGLNWDNGGGWEDGTTNYFPDWLQVDFSGSKIIDRINVFTSQDNYNAPVEPTPELTFASRGIRDFSVQYWDGAAWINVPGGSVTNNDKVWRQFAFTPITTAKIRVLVTRATMSSRIAEVEAFESSLPADTRFLAKQVYDCDSAGNNCQLLRSTYVRYEQDQGLDPLSPEVANTNRREASTRIVYHDDIENGVARFADIDKSNFDGLGHYRQITTNGNFGGGDVRTVFLNYDAATGIYPSAGYVMPAPSTPWILYLLSQQKITETTQGASAQVMEFCYDRNTGFLKRTRQWVSTNTAGTAGLKDLVKLFTPDAYGQTIKEQYYGGDIQAVGTEPLCSLTLPATDQYQIQSTYQYGSLSSRQFYTAAGTAFGQKQIDQIIDRNTGLASIARDLSGIATSYEYDGMGRQTWVKPEAGHGAWKQFTYTPASATDYAKKFIYDKTNGTGTVITYNLEAYDSFDRLWWEQTTIQGSYPNRYRNYNAMDWLTQRSEFSTAAPKYTENLDYDPFGRPRTVRPSDGSQHDVTYQYAGISKVVRTAKAGYSYYPASGQVVEAPKSKTQLFDHQGRLWKEATQTRNGMPDYTTVNYYDVGNHLIKTTNGNGVLTGSILSYDGRGFMFYAYYSSGNNSYYQNFDAMGNSLKQRPMLTDLNYTFDRAGRLLSVSETSNPAKIWKQFTYGDSNGTNDWRAGKLVNARRYNYINDSAGPVGGVAVVSENYTYGEQGGKLSNYEVSLSDAAGLREQFAQVYTYTELGEVQQINYPNSTFTGSGDMGRVRTVRNNYVADRLTSITGTLNSQPENWVNSITYHPNGLTSQVAHANGVTDNMVNDPNGFIRVASVFTTGVQKLTGQADQNFSSGDFQYDGNQALVRIGTRYFIPADGASQPPPPGNTPPADPRCPNQWTDPFGVPVTSMPDSDCVPSIFYYRTASDSLFKMEDHVENTKTWFFYDRGGRRLSEYKVLGTLGTWISTRDYIYRGSSLLGIEEFVNNVANPKVYHFHIGYGITGIQTDGNGYRTELID